MLILFDHGAPRGLAGAFVDCKVVTAQARGWDTLDNGALLAAAEAAGFDVMLTTDRRIRYQQNLSGRKIALVVLVGSTKWSRVRLHVSEIIAAVEASSTGSYSEVSISFD
jgi:hypothetical protein